MKKAVCYINENGYIIFSSCNSPGTISADFKNIGICSKCGHICLGLLTSLYNTYRDKDGKKYLSTFCCKCLGTYGLNSLKSQLRSIVCQKCAMELLMASG